jgi:signal transduction histidine kinase
MHRLDTVPDPTKLHANRLFTGIPSDIVDDFGTDVDLVQFDNEDIIFEEGERGDCLYLVVEGAVRVSKMGRGGKQETLTYIQPGSFFGEMSLIDGQPRSAQASAAEPCTLGRIDTAAFERILSRAPNTLHRNLLRFVVERLRGINSHFIDELMRTERLSLVGSMANSIIHDLKNPINAIQLSVGLIEERCKDPAIGQFTGITQKAIASMMDMVQELLDFALGKSSLQLERWPAQHIFTELDSQLLRLLPAKIHVIRDLHFCDEVQVDLGRFVRVLLNLIKNSIEAMPKGGVLRLGLRQEGDRAIFLVGDTGPGIPPELLPRIFEPFVTRGKSQGTGLGLAIARSVVETHGGTIDLRSKPGIGTTIEISLPTVPVV